MDKCESVIIIKCEDGETSQSVEDTMENENSPDIAEHCIVCYKPITAAFDSSEMNLLTALCKTLKFPVKLAEEVNGIITNSDFCENCSAELIHAKAVLEEIEKLESVVEERRSTIKQSILSSYNQENLQEDKQVTDKKNARIYLKKTFVQCWVTCTVDLFPVSRAAYVAENNAPTTRRTRQKRPNYLQMLRGMPSKSPEQSKDCDDDIPVDNTLTSVLKIRQSGGNISIEQKGPRKRRGRPVVLKRSNNAKRAKTSTPKKNPPRPPPGKYGCSCGEIFSDVEMYLKHQKSHDAYCCYEPTCRRTYSTVLELNKHVYERHKTLLDVEKYFSCTATDSNSYCPFCGMGLLDLTTGDTVELNVSLPDSDGTKQVERITPESHIEECKKAVQAGTEFRVLDKNGKIVSFTCEFCATKMSVSDFVTEEGTFVFKCSPSICCDKQTSSFANLMLHHESSCRLNPNVSRKSVPGYVYDQYKCLVAKECKLCGLQMSRLDYYVTETDEYKFACKEDRCGKLFDNFGNVSTHHNVHCNSANRRPKQPSVREILSQVIVGTAAASGGSFTDREYDEHGRLLSFHCHRCDVKCRPDDFLNPAADEHDFRCWCEGCTKSTATFANLMVHHETHCTPQKNRMTIANYNKTGKLESFKCYLCNHIIKNVPNSENMNFPCEVCDRICESFPTLRDHHESHCIRRVKVPKLPLKKTKSPTKSNECSRCGKAFSKAKALEAHQARCLTADAGKFPCSLCDRDFATKELLKIHKRFHTSDTEHICNVCDRKYKSFQELKLHMKTHSLEKTSKNTSLEKSTKNTTFKQDSIGLACTKCSSTFTSATLLQQHELCHQRQDVECKHCDRMFKSIYDLNVHIRRVHPSVCTE